MSGCYFQRSASCCSQHYKYPSQNTCRLRRWHQTRPALEGGARRHMAPAKPSSLNAKNASFRFALLWSLDIDYREQVDLAKQAWRSVKLSNKEKHTWLELDDFLRRLDKARIRMIRAECIVEGGPKSIDREVEDRRKMIPRGTHLYGWLQDRPAEPRHHTQFVETIR